MLKLIHLFLVTTLMSTGFFPLWHTVKMKWKYFFSVDPFSRVGALLPVAVVLLPSIGRRENFYQTKSEVWSICSYRNKIVSHLIVLNWFSSSRKFLANVKKFKSFFLSRIMNSGKFMNTVVWNSNWVIQIIFHSAAHAN